MRKYKILFEEIREVKSHYYIYWNISRILKLTNLSFWTSYELFYFIRAKIRNEWPMNEYQTNTLYAFICVILYACHIRTLMVKQCSYISAIPSVVSSVK